MNYYLLLGTNVVNADSRCGKVFESEGVLCRPIAYEYVRSLDAILVPFGKLFYYAEDILTCQEPPLDCLFQLEHDLASLERQFNLWSLSQSDPWLPQTVGRVTTASIRSPDCAYYHSGPADSYLDCELYASNSNCPLIELHSLRRCYLEYVSQVSYHVT